MKKHRRALQIVAFTYLILWGCSAIIVYPGELIEEIEFPGRKRAKYPTLLNRSISFAPALLWVDWQEGDQAFDCAGYRGVFFATPFATFLLWKQSTWIS